MESGTAKSTSVPSADGAVPVIGRVVATERRPNTPHEFHFWTEIGAPVGIGTIVRVVGTHPVAGQIPTVYGVVVEGFYGGDGVFHSDTVMVKHDSVYRPPSPGAAPPAPVKLSGG